MKAQIKKGVLKYNPAEIREPSNNLTVWTEIFNSNMQIMQTLDF